MVVAGQKSPSSPLLNREPSAQRPKKSFGASLHQLTAQPALRGAALSLVLLAGGGLMLAPKSADAQVLIGVRVNVAPPPLPYYEQPPLPGPDYIWTPGYWAWDEDVYDYYWVPGTWVLAPYPGYLWTPGYWGWDNGVYLYNSGYWGPHVGYYGGVNYGFGYTGYGFEGGYWNGDHYFYNRSVNNISGGANINVYNKTVVENRTNVASYNGGPGGVRAQPTQAQLSASRENHIQPTAMQAQQIQSAQGNHSLFAAANHGAPPVAATARPGQFSGPGVVRSQGPAAAGRGYQGAPMADRYGARPSTVPPSQGGPTYGRQASPEAYDRQAPSAAYTAPRGYTPPANYQRTPTPPPGGYAGAPPVAYGGAPGAGRPAFAPPRPVAPPPPPPKAAAPRAPSAPKEERKPGR